MFTVTSAADSGAGSLRDAITRANNLAGVDTIAFNLPAGGRVIRPTSELPAVADTIVDGTTQPGYAGKPLVQIDGAPAGSARGLRLEGSAVVKGLSITRFTLSGIDMPIVRTGLGGNTVTACWVGLDLAGNAAGNTPHGIGVYTPSNVIGGATAADRNVISAGTMGVYVLGAAASRNAIMNNYVGTDPTGMLARGNTKNGIGVQDAPYTQVLNNVCSANGDDGIILLGSTKTNVVQGNVCGLAANGNALLANGLYGIEISSFNNTIGGTTAAARNVFSGNKKAGVVLYTASGTGNLIQGNYIGTDITGTLDRGNTEQGIAIASAVSNAIRGNLISGNDREGVGIFPGSDTTVQGNVIGFSSLGTPLTNATWGVTLVAGASGNLVGGTAAGQANVIYSGHPSGTIVNTGSNNTISTNQVVAVETMPPKVAAATFVYDAKPQAIRYTFSANVSASLGLADLTVKNTMTGAIVSATAMAYDAATRTATFTFASTLPAGAYQATLASAGVADSSGNALDGDGNGSAGGNYSFTFYFLPGDANHDGRVDFNDMVLVSQNYNLAAHGYGTGDFNFDGRVDFSDLVILSQNYNVSVAVPAAGAAAEVTAAAESAESLFFDDADYALSCASGEACGAGAAGALVI